MQGQFPAVPLSRTRVDQGYLSKVLLRLWQQGLHWVTGIGHNRKNDLLPLLDKVLLRKRCIIKALFDKLKSSMSLEHTRHRSPVNALVYILSCLAAYTLAQPKVNIGNFNFAIPNPMPTIPSIPSPYPQLGLAEQHADKCSTGFAHGWICVEERQASGFSSRVQLVFMTRYRKSILHSKPLAQVAASCIRVGGEDWASRS